jgi:thymidylate synthase
LSQFDVHYAELVRRIQNEGVWSHGNDVRARWKDGSPAHTKSIFFHTMTFYPHEVPILTTKFNSPETATKEMFWIWKDQSNKVQDIRDQGVTIWDEWELHDGTIGKAYGSQLRKGVIKGNLFSKEITQYPNQVDYVLGELERNPSSRRIMTELWNVDDLSRMSLPPCVHHTQWDTFDGSLNLMVKTRSSDVGLGLPFNIFQYAVLHRLVARHVEMKLGKMHFVMGNVHIYDRHMDVLREQITREPKNAPVLAINPEVTNFYDFKPEDVKVVCYDHHGKLRMEIAE